MENQNWGNNPQQMQQNWSSGEIHTIMRIMQVI